ncbi:MAG TPA: peptidogalycan biosysnthesis protein [Rhodanobacter sp.]|nr:peptidogalycan biosysnthesis protein [Rhodanobacter sp.]
MLTARFHTRITDVPAAAWDALRPDANPFIAHAFLAALERDGCVRAEWGWQAHHLGLYEDHALVAAAPLYLKTNSHGEYVFDFSWADAWQRAGGAYYPKLLNAVPYSPVPGPRLLAGAGPRTPALQQQLVAAMRTEAEHLGLSSVHANFLLPSELAAFAADTAQHAWLTRSDIQFHWHNHGYRHFPAFLATLTHKKRKNILRERTQVAASGLAIEWRDGADLREDEWQQVHALYAATFAVKGNRATLSAAFFRELGKLGLGTQLALARHGSAIVAMALFLRSDRVLYGRYWGTRVVQPGLHFELCYYRGIEYAIAQRLVRFEPGAQGEHKLARGFLPARTNSRHYLLNADFHAAVAAALVHERAAVGAYADELTSHNPYAIRESTPQ